MDNNAIDNSSFEDFQPECDTYLLFALMHSTVHAVNCDLIVLNHEPVGDPNVSEVPVHTLHMNDVAAMSTQPLDRSGASAG
jgi:hypothetical protein